jgi:hypothetical protein
MKLMEYLIPAVIMLWTAPVHTQLITGGGFPITAGRLSVSTGGRHRHPNESMFSVEAATS